MKASRFAALAVALAVLGFGFWTRAGLGARRAAAPAGAAPFRLTEEAARAGLSFTPGRFAPHPSLANLAPRLGSLGVSVAVVDFDGDGWQDVFVSNPARGGRNRLFRNRHDGTFVDAAAAAGLDLAGGAAGSMRALFFDSRNAGRQDLLLTTSSCAVFFANQGDGTFRDETARSGLGHCGVSYATNALDYDGDGFLDVVIADYFKAVDFSTPAAYDFMPNSGVAADNGGPIVVYHNEGGGRFRPAKGNLGIASRGWTLSASVYDLRGSGRPDLYFATDFNSDQAYFNEGGGRFKDASRLVEDKYSRNGMTAEIADVDNDGRAAVFVTNIHEPPYALGANMLWKWLPGDRFADVAGMIGLSECGWSWGAKFLDLDHDGLQDLVVTNGYISANPKRDYWYESGLMSAAAGPVAADARNWPPMKDASLGGFQKKCVYRNAGWRFENVTDATGWADDRSDGRGLAAIDLMNDGSLSLIEANEGQPLRFYRGRPADESNRWIGFKLVGTRSSRDAFGAKVKVRLAGKTLSREVQPANGFMAQSDGRVHFGIGREEVEEAVVRWPSGSVQTLKRPAAGRYHAVAEPSAQPPIRAK